MAKVESFGYRLLKSRTEAMAQVEQFDVELEKVEASIADTREALQALSDKYDLGDKPHRIEEDSPHAIIPLDE